MYTPTPINTSAVKLDEELTALTEKIAENVYEVWAAGRIAEGWRYSEERNDKERTTPCLVSYSELSETENDYDRNTALETKKLIIAPDYKITKKNKSFNERKNHYEPYRTAGFQRHCDPMPRRPRRKRDRFGLRSVQIPHITRKTPRLIYSGRTEIKKPNIKLMIDKLKIPAEYVTALDHKPELLVTVDCVYGESNVQKFKAENIAVIDHHISNKELPMLSEIQSDYGSCASLAVKMLGEEFYDINADKDLAAALYYGLYMDTNGFSELGHPADKDLRDFARFNEAMLNLLRNSNLSCDDMKTAANALANCEYDFNSHNAIAMVEPCDPSILGFIGDLLIQVNNIKTCIVLPFGIVL